MSFGLMPFKRTLLSDYFDSSRFRTFYTLALIYDFFEGKDVHIREFYRMLAKARCANGRRSFDRKVELR
jgi:hypothetical protein